MYVQMLIVVITNNYGFRYIFIDKEQADKMIEFIGNRSERKQTVQVSTVDAFQVRKKKQ